MQKEMLLALLDQNRSNCYATFKNISAENIRFRLNEKTASVGFIYRHIGETALILGQSFGIETNVENTTIGQSDTGKEYDLQTSRALLEQGYKALEAVIENSSDKDWFEETEAPFLGTVSRIRLLSIILFHNSHHCGQIASAIVKGN
ncbi:DinB family protein [Flavobacterium sp. Fl-318]|uniref:DinB family protein n=1 Tax=Flavobacterium cupriresistens TaxID=2893885 RepID=A0ABU4RDS9_9FLAO|nr:MULTISPECIES: DinB family protein [unclassified Flavobacterium]MDX6188671.1 DinB family protein [Flavobacterium sp. Fl-318]UFH44541.1 DinB family protein [Flavobacterium sp. F-323]